MGVINRLLCLLNYLLEVRVLGKKSGLNPRQLNLGLGTGLSDISNKNGQAQNSVIVGSKKGVGHGESLASRWAS